MSNHVKYHFNKTDKPPRRLDPRMVELVRFLARRAAERDFKAYLLRSTALNHNNNKEASS